MINRRLALASPLLMTACSTPGPAAFVDLREGQHRHDFILAGQAAAVRSWLYLPKGYLSNSAAWPLVIFLHGSGERGDDTERVKVHGPPKLAARGVDYPFVLVSPQLEAGARWSPDRLHGLLAAVQTALRIDARRVCATGLSLGGYGVWNWAAAYPQDLAGIAPVCGYGDPAAVCRAKAVPVRAYHGAADPVVPLAGQQACVDALRACGGEVSFTIYPGVGHDAWNPAYEDPALVPWLMARRRS